MYLKHGAVRRTHRVTMAVSRMWRGRRVPPERTERQTRVRNVALPKRS
jgi:hypothetical protein